MSVREYIIIFIPILPIYVYLHCECEYFDKTVKLNSEKVIIMYTFYK